MRVLTVLCAVIVAAAATPIPPSAFTGFQRQGFNGYTGFVQNQPQAVVPILSVKSYSPVVQHFQHSQPIAILRAESDQNPDGSYHYSYETENGIAVQEQGAQKQIGAEAGTVAQGSYEYTAPDGQKIVVQYVADENGFQPQGNALPVPPPVPEAILKSLAYNAAHPEEDNL